MVKKRLNKRGLHPPVRLSGDDDFYRPEKRELLSFTGSLIDKTPKTYKIAKLQKWITCDETDYNKKLKYLELSGILSQWFKTDILDRISLLLMKVNDKRENSIEEEIKKFLGYIDTFLRLDGNTIRWKALIEIGKYFNTDITRKSLFKYKTEAQKALIEEYGRKNIIERLRKSPELLVKRLVSEFVSEDIGLNEEEKVLVRTGCFQIITAMRKLRFIPRDYEIYSYGIFYLIKKKLTGKSGKYTFPVNTPAFRKSIGNAIYKIKHQVIKKVSKNNPTILGIIEL